MTKKASKAAPKKPSTAYTWFDPEATDQLRQRLNEAGPGARLEVREKAGALYLRVVPSSAPAAAVVTPDDINKSHTCPPQCP